MQGVRRKRLPGSPELAMTRWYIRCRQYCPWWAWPFVVAYALVHAVLGFLGELL
jgi:hypothetical protein